jgi:hypothetical protein
MQMWFCLRLECTVFSTVCASLVMEGCGQSSGEQQGRKRVVSYEFR